MPDVRDHGRGGAGSVSWVVVTVAALTAVVAVNVALLSYGGDRHDPVGRLSPVATVPAPAPPSIRSGEDD
jgi:hypothetical protein